MKWKTYQIPEWIAKFVPRRVVKPNHLARDQRHRAFAGAASNNLTFSWSSEEKTADQILFEDLQKLRGRCRQLVRDNDYARKYVELVCDNVIGHAGITMQAQVRTTTGTRNKAACEIIERHWKKWGRREGCEVTGHLSWVDVQRLVARTWATDGESFVRRVPLGPYRFQLQPIDSALIDVGFNDTRSNGAQIRLGIELDQYGRPAAYYMMDNKHGEYFGAASYNKHVRIPASEMYHTFKPDLVGQSRGVPRMATAMLRLDMLAGYEEAALVNARQGASNVVYMAAPDGGEGFPLDGRDVDGVAVEDVEPGTTKLLPPGYTPIPYDPTYPSGEHSEFVKAFLRGIASGVGVDYSAISGDLEGVNYSSIRAGVLETREVWKGLQQFFIDQFLRPVYEDWLKEQLLNETLTRPNGLGALRLVDIERYLDVNWQGRRWSWVDPLKDQQANALALSMGVTSVTAIIKETGEDPDEIWAQNVADNENVVVAAVGTQPPEDEDYVEDDEE